MQPRSRSDLNMVAFLPMLGMGQAVSILVGQRLGANRARPGPAVGPSLRIQVGFRIHGRGRGNLPVLPRRAVVQSLRKGGRDPERLRQLAALVPRLLVCVAIYSLADSLQR